MTLLFVFLLLMGAVGGSAWAEPSHTTTPTTAGSEIKGDVLYWEGDELIVREISGHEVRLRVTQETKIENASGKLKTGDKIVAKVAPDGPALTITLQIPDSERPAAPIR
jgi:hypothetical protein